MRLNVRHSLTHSLTQSALGLSRVFERSPLRFVLFASQKSRRKKERKKVREEAGGVIDVGRGRRLFPPPLAPVPKLRPEKRPPKVKSADRPTDRIPPSTTMEKDSLGHGRIWAKCTPFLPNRGGSYLEI